MARDSVGVMVRHWLGNRTKLCAPLLLLPHYHHHHHKLPSHFFQTLASIPTTHTAAPPNSNPSSNPLHHFPNHRCPPHRSLSSPSGPSNIVVINSEDAFNSAISKVEDGASPAIFYFTAVWCGPCRFISPTIGELSEKYPHVTTYKIDIDEEGLASTLGKLNISSVPTFHFFQDGKKAAEVIGADVGLLKDTFGKLYKQE